MKNPKIKYSKPSIDIQKESTERAKKSQNILSDNIRVSNYLKEGSPRNECIICKHDLKGGSAFNHRGIFYIACESCEHVQTQIVEPNGYPYEQMAGGFEKLYHRLDVEGYRDRTERIYKPKLDWVVDSLEDHNLSDPELVEKSWLEIGCGAGHFIRALKDLGVRNVRGLDVSEELLRDANRGFKAQVAFQTSDLIADLERSDADIIVAFFVIEHLQNPRSFWRAMGRKKKGTILIFSVPTFGISAHAEAALTNRPARNFDNVFHTQLYTERSIDFILKETEYKVLSEWVFGQDSQDLISYILDGYREFQDIDFIRRNIQKVQRLIDPIQELIDRSHLSDSKHIIAIKT